MNFGRKCFMALMFMGAGVMIGNLVATAAETAPKYDGVLAALEGGKPVHVLADLSRCVMSNTGKPGPAVQGGMRIDSFIVTERGLAFSDVHKTLDMSGHPETEYIRYTVKADGQIVIRIAHMINGASDAVITNEYACSSPDGVKFVW